MSSDTHSLQPIMSDALMSYDHDGKVCIGGRNITSLMFPENVDAV